MGGFLNKMRKNATYRSVEKGVGRVSFFFSFFFSLVTRTCVLFPANGYSTCLALASSVGGEREGGGGGGVIIRRVCCWLEPPFSDQ